MRSGHTEIELAVRAEEAWAALVGPERHEWYYRLTPEGEFATGAHIRWIDIRGDPAEESDVVDATPPTHLALLTRYVFAPSFAALEPHLAEWDIVPLDAGCRVRFSWHARDWLRRCW